MSDAVNKVKLFESQQIRNEWDSEAEKWWFSVVDVVADTEPILRLIQSIPSKRAEPFKLWLAEVGSQRLDQLQDPELSIEQAMLDYKRLTASHVF